ncbi:MAG: hypothetical protein AAGJ46_05965 [Planctomycetota bacterium]
MIVLFAALAPLGVLPADGSELRRLPPVEPAPVDIGAASWDGGVASLASEAATPATTTPVPPEAAATPVQLANFQAGPVEFGYEPPDFETGVQFNKGLFIKARDLDENPFSMYVGGRMQLRHIGFARDEETWTDNAGVTRPIRNRNQFDMERARINFSGNAISPDMTYLFILDMDGDGGSITDGLAYFFQYEVNPALKIRMGRWKAAAHREWLLSSRYLTLSDRSMATEFFRVGFSDGVWLIGDFTLFDRCDDRRPLHYEMSLTNGVRTSSRRALLLDDNLGAAATLYWDGGGKYGAGAPDFLYHKEPVFRLGCSVAHDKSDDRSDAGTTFALGDDNFVRLSDGTRLADVGSLAPGVQLLGDRVFLAAVDFGFKYRGWSASCEYFIRELYDFVADGPLPVGSLYSYGYHAHVGKFITPQRWDVNFRMSEISGFLGSGFEYSLGTTYYFGGDRDQVNKLNFDVTNVVQSPINSGLADILAGDDGILFRTQVQIGF